MKTKLTIFTLFYFIKICSLENGTIRTDLKHQDGSPIYLTCRECPEGTIKTKNCSKELDTQCTTCYKPAILDNSENTCNECTICEPGTFVQGNCSKFDDTVCSPCPIGTFSATENEELCLECRQCAGMNIKTECTNSSDAVCERLEELDYAVVIAIVAGVVEGIVTLILIIVCIIRAYRKKVKKEESSPEAQPMTNASVPIGATNTDETQGNKTQKKTKVSLKLEDLKKCLGVLVFQEETKGPNQAERGQYNRGQTRSIMVMRVGNYYGITALQALKRKINPGQGQVEDTAYFSKLTADNVYIEFFMDDNSVEVIKRKITGNTPQFEDEDLDIVIFKMKKVDSGTAHPKKDLLELKLSKFYSVHEPEQLQLFNFKGQKRKLDAKNAFLLEGHEDAKNIFESVLDNPQIKLKLITDKNYRRINDLKNSICELARNLCTKGSEYLEKMSDVLKDREELKEVVAEPIYQKDVTTIFVSGEYSFGCVGCYLDNTGSLQVDCILTHRVPKVFDILDEEDQQLHFKSMKMVTAGVKIKAVYESLRKSDKKNLIKAIFESEI